MVFWWTNQPSTVYNFPLICHFPSTVHNFPQISHGILMVQLEAPKIAKLVYKSYEWFVPTPPLSAQQDSAALSRGDALALRATSFCSHPPLRRWRHHLFSFLVVALLKATNRSPLRGYMANICLGRSLAFAPQNRRPVSPLLSWACELITYEWFVPTPPLSAQQDSAALSRGDALALRATSFCSQVQ